jgi:DNA-binding NarL/FixJ family response regulator
MDNQVRDSTPRVTRKELGVLRLLARGLGTVAIAEQMRIGPGLTSVRRKTGCRERVQLADWYRKHYGRQEEPLHPV